MSAVIPATLADPVSTQAAQPGLVHLLLSPLPLPSWVLLLCSLVAISALIGAFHFNPFN